MLKKDRSKKGGKIAIKHLNQLLNQSYKNKQNTSDKIDNYETYNLVSKIKSFFNF